ncbi:MAG: KamA family radical SAM protein [Deltaproteobacteria bacterium]|nr:KamA family radical SAM protein [Candidatus Anaeroferrophillus wilburensis]MBN2888531.1 KamA family radical SAM protein [Deltaproteobacteria bacterium]
MDYTMFTAEYLTTSFPLFFTIARQTFDLGQVRDRLALLVTQLENDAYHGASSGNNSSRVCVRDCARVMRGMLRKRTDRLAGFSIARVISDLAKGKPRPDLQTAFFADFYHVLAGLHGLGPNHVLMDIPLEVDDLQGREAAVARSQQLDSLWEEVEQRLARYVCGLEPKVVKQRQERRDVILAGLAGTLSQWQDWRWQLRHVVQGADQLADLITLDGREKAAVSRARQLKVPFGITPHYLSLMDAQTKGLDRSIRAQVLPPADYVEKISISRSGGDLDFMREEDTSPIDLITRRYPAICIFKPYNTCPQICVYCQRNWEIDDAMAPGALAAEEQIDAAVDWLRAHPAIREVLVTGGDPLALDDGMLESILSRIAAIPTVDRLRIGTRTLVTMPMRITAELARMLGSFRKLGRREVAVVTHVQHVYELTPEVAAAVNNLRLAGIPVYNQLVYTFYTSRRFEAVALRRQLRLIGIDPYYTFNTKGKEETFAYRVPIARLLQEQKEEARLLPGLGRTDEAVYNVPGLGKNYLRAQQQRDLLSILPDGTRVYEFYPWELNISQVSQTYVGHDVPILDYLERLEKIGESAADYWSIWNYY